LWLAVNQSCCVFSASKWHHCCATGH